MNWDDLSYRLRRAMEESGFNRKELALALGWTVEKIEAILEGRLRDLEDVDLVRLSVILNRPPHYFQRGVDELKKLPAKDVPRFKTLLNISQFIIEFQLTQELEEHLLKMALEGAGKRRRAGVITRSTLTSFLRGILSEPGDATGPQICPLSNRTCVCGLTHLSSRGECPYRQWEE